MSDNQLNELPKVWNLPQISVIDIKNNSLTTYPEFYSKQHYQNQEADNSDFSDELGIRKNAYLFLGNNPFKKNLQEPATWELLKTHPSKTKKLIIPTTCANLAR